MITGFMYKNL